MAASIDVFSVHTASIRERMLEELYTFFGLKSTLIPVAKRSKLDKPGKGCIMDLFTGRYRFMLDKIRRFFAKRMRPNAGSAGLPCRGVPVSA
jgi:hypothetical protein